MAECHQNRQSFRTPDNPLGACRHRSLERGGTDEQSGLAGAVRVDDGPFDIEFDQKIRGIT